MLATQELVALAQAKVAQGHKQESLSPLPLPINLPLHSLVEAAVHKVQMVLPQAQMNIHQQHGACQVQLLLVPQTQT